MLKQSATNWVIKTTEIYCSQLWWLEVQDQGICRAGSMKIYAQETSFKFVLGETVVRTFMPYYDHRTQKEEE